MFTHFKKETEAISYPSGRAGEKIVSISLIGAFFIYVLILSGYRIFPLCSYSAFRSGTFEIFHLRMQLADSSDLVRAVPLALRHRLSPGLPHILICFALVDELRFVP